MLSITVCSSSSIQNLWSLFPWIISLARQTADLKWHYSCRKTSSIASQIPEDIHKKHKLELTQKLISMGRLISLLLLSSSLKGCELYAFCGALFGITSMITLMVIALDRYFVITKPLASVGVTSKKKALIILVGVWLYSLAWSLPPFFGWSKWNQLKVIFPHSTGLKISYSYRRGLN